MGRSVPLSAELFDRVVSLRRDLHRHPELSWDETRTMARIAGQLDELGLPYRCEVAGTGIIADLPGCSDGPHIALRADMDALPVHEKTGLPFASCVDGVMHACGHDGHSSMLLGAAALLQATPPPLPVRLLWQPAEEHGSGALALIEDGALEGVAMIFGGHVDRLFAPGVLAITEGAVNASTDTFRIEISGRQGHGARPHEAVDAIVVGAALVTALQTIVSREVNPAAPAVISVGRFEAGSASNVIAGSAFLEGTIRAQDPETRAQLCAALPRVAEAIGQVHRAEIRSEVIPGTPPVINPVEATDLARRAALSLMPAERVVRMETANMGGEDFAQYLQHVPGCYIRYGARVPGRESYPAHSSRFDIHEDALAWGAAWLDRVARVAGEHLS